MYKFLFKSKILGFVEAPVGVFSYIFETNIFAFNVKAILSLEIICQDTSVAKTGFIGLRSENIFRVYPVRLKTLLLMSSPY